MCWFLVGNAKYLGILICQQTKTLDDITLCFRILWSAFFITFWFWMNDFRSADKLMPIIVAALILEPSWLLHSDFFQTIQCIAQAFC